MTQQAIDGWRYYYSDGVARRLEPIARARHEPKRRAGVKNKKVVDAPEADVDMLGVLAEFAAAMVLCGKPLLTHKGLTGDGNGADVILLDGTTVEVKATRSPGLNLLFLGADRHYLKSDLVVLVWPLLDADVPPQFSCGFEVVRWLSRAEVNDPHGIIQTEDLKQKSTGIIVPTQVGRWQRMHTMDTLVPLLDRAKEQAWGIPVHSPA